jgi:hypothetical protein
MARMRLLRRVRERVGSARSRARAHAWPDRAERGKQPKKLARRDGQPTRADRNLDEMGGK